MKKPRTWHACLHTLKFFFRAGCPAYFDGPCVNRVMECDMMQGKGLHTAKRRKEGKDAYLPDEPGEGGFAGRCRAGPSGCLVMGAVHIVTGEINAGKTTRMRDLYRQTAAADGFLSEKRFDREGFCGYHLVRLRSGETMDLALPEAAYHGQFSQACRLGRFVFSDEAFRIAEAALAQLCADPEVSAIFLDEVGPLELRGQGFAGTLPALLRSGKELYITVRTGCLQTFIRTYGLAQYQLIPVP